MCHKWSTRICQLLNIFAEVIGDPTVSQILYGHKEEEGNYQRKILRKKEEHPLSTKKKKGRNKDLDQEKKQVLICVHFRGFFKQP